MLLLFLSKLAKAACLLLIPAPPAIVLFISLENALKELLFSSIAGETLISVLSFLLAVKTGLGISGVFLVKWRLTKLSTNLPLCTRLLAVILAPKPLPPLPLASKLPVKGVSLIVFNIGFLVLDFGCF